MSFYIRADGNGTIMTGHIMRCLSIARAMRTLGTIATFILADQTMSPFIESQGFPTIILHSDWENLQLETQKMVLLLKSRSVKTLLLDSYSVNAEYMKALQKVVTLAYIDDLNQFPYPCDYLINYNHYASKLSYSPTSSNTRFLLGAQFAPLRPEFYKLPPFSVNKVARNILITTGGSDPYNIAGQVAAGLERYAPGRFDISVVAGALNTYINDLTDLQNNNRNIKVFHSVDNISDLMKRNDICVSAGGSTLYELCAVGIPTIFFTFADNQSYMKDAFAPHALLYAGDCRSDTKECLLAIIDGVLSLSDSSFEIRHTHSRTMQSIVDGQGALRLAEILQKTLSN